MIATPLPSRSGFGCSRRGCHVAPVVTLRSPMGAVVSYCLGHSDGHAIGAEVLWLRDAAAVCPRCSRVTSARSALRHFDALGVPCHAALVPVPRRLLASV